MNICLIRPSRLIVLSGVNQSNAPPLGLAFIAASLRKAGHSVFIIDSIAEAPNQINKHYENENYVSNGLTPEEIVSRIPASTDVIGISSMFSMNWVEDRRLIDYIGKRFPCKLIVGGGEHITAAPEFSLRQAKYLNVCVMGEGEETMVSLVDAYQKGSDLSSVNGIVYKTKEGEIVKTVKRNRIKAIEQIPYPAWDLLPIEAYQKNMMIYGVPQGRSLPILASRGCPYECTFCSNPVMWGKNYNIRTPKEVADEMELFHHKYNINNFDFFDLTAILKKDWVVEFAKEIIIRNMNITWQLPAGTRSEAIDRECAKYLYLSGCRYLSYAPESGSHKILKLIKKKVKLDKMIESMEFAFEEKLHIKLNMIFGLPDETHADVWKTLWFLVKCSWIGVHEIGPSSFQPYPGSALFERLVKEGKIDMNNDDYFFNMVKSDDFFQTSFYNDNMSFRWMRFYQIFGVILFYSSNFLFRPIRLARLLKGVITQKYNSKLEVAIVHLLSKKRLLSEEMQSSPIPKDVHLLLKDYSGHQGSTN